MNCHMPHTSFGLFTAMRSHRVDSPNAATSAKTGRPNACNLCHLDRTLTQTAADLERWYGQPVPAPMPPEHEGLAASMVWLLTGDAVVRSITAWHMGWQPALDASGRGWQAPVLAATLVE